MIEGAKRVIDMGFHIALPPVVEAATPARFVLLQEIVKLLLHRGELTGAQPQASDKVGIAGALAPIPRHFQRGAIDAGTWRRLIVVPFNARITRSGDIKNYAEYLYENAGPAILAPISILEN